MRRTRTSARQPKKQPPEKDETGQKITLSNINEHAILQASSSFFESAGVVPDLDSTPPLPSDQIVLRNGKAVPLSKAVECFESLQRTLKYHPEEVAVLKAIADRRLHSEEQVEARLCDAGLILNGRLRPPYDDVLASSELTEDGGRRELTLPCLPSDEGRWREQTEQMKQQFVRRFRSGLPGSGGVAPG